MNDAILRPFQQYFCPVLYCIVVLRPRLTSKVMSGRSIKVVI